MVERSEMTYDDMMGSLRFRSLGHYFSSGELNVI